MSVSIGLDKGLALNRQQAIIWTNADRILCRIYATPGGDELKLSEVKIQQYIK